MLMMNSNSLATMYIAIAVPALIIVSVVLFAVCSTMLFLASVVALSIWLFILSARVVGIWSSFVFSSLLKFFINVVSIFSSIWVFSIITFDIGLYNINANTTAIAKDANFIKLPASPLT